MAIKRNLIPELNILIPFFGSNNDRFMSVKSFDVSKILGIGRNFTLDDVTRFNFYPKLSSSLANVIESGSVFRKPV